MVDHDALPAGTRFGELEIIRVLGVGGFGIVYLARDHALEREVALKEYMPASLAARGIGPKITVRTGAPAEIYAVGLRSFINEARLLAHFDHPSLVKVYRFWEDNATAYMVMPYLQGRTLRDVRRSMSQPPNEGWIRVLLDSLLSALELLHREGVYHRDIAPDNVLLPPDAPPVLLDFGAARRVISDRTQSLTAILKPNYAPIEQYAEMTQMRQGPWTDLYALGAVAHFLIFGFPPSAATARAVHDDLAALAQRQVPGISPRLLGIVAWMLAVRPQQRPQNVEALRAVLEGRASVPVVAAENEVIVSDETLPLPGSGVYAPTLRVESNRAAPRDSAYQPTMRAARPAEDEVTVIRPAAAVGAAAMPRVAAPVASSSRRSLVAAAIGVVVVAGAALWWFGTRHAGPVVSGTAARLPAFVAASAPESPPATPAAAPVPTPEPAAVQPPITPTAAVVASPAAASRPKAVAKPVRTSAAAVPNEAPRSPEPVAVAPAENDAKSRPVAVAAAPAGPATAREACGKRVFLALWTCMDSECERPAFRDHPDCVKVLEVKRRRESQ